MSTVSYYTAEGLKKLREELDQLKSIERPKASQAIADARDKGDLSENAEYDAAKEAQGLLEARIAKMEDLVANARLIDESQVDNSKVYILSRVKLSVAHYRRNLPLFMEVKNLLDQGLIGDIKELSITMLKKTNLAANDPNNWRIDPSVAGGGYFYDLAPHQIDLVFYFLGNDLKSYSGSSKNKAGMYAAEDFVEGIIEMGNGIICKGLWDFSIIDQEEKDEFLITGTKGTIRFPVFGLFIELELNGVIQKMEFEAPKHNQQNHIQQVVDFFLGKGENPCSADDAILSMQVMEAFVYGK